MSKLQLKKELKTLNDEQLRELILDVYTSVKPARQYFDFFLDPDVGKLTDRYTRAIAKEMNRCSRSRCKSRISVIKAAIKEFESYGPGAEHVMSLWIETVRLGLDNIRIYWCTDAFQRGVYRLAEDCMRYADSNLLLDKAIERLTIIGRERDSYVNRRLLDVIAGVIDELASGPDLRK